MILKKDSKMKFKKEFLQSVDSTNDYAKRLIKSKHLEPTLIIADTQSNGRGRGLHTWESSCSGNIYSTYVYRIEISLKYLPIITLVTALGAARAINKILKNNTDREFKIEIKWPNDILLNGKKIVGILTELEQRQTDYYVIIGIGLNVSWSDDDIKKANLPYAGAINQIMNLSLPKEEVQEIIEEHLGEIFDDFLKEGSFDAFFEEYNSYLMNKDKTLYYTKNNIEKSGLCLGLNASGELLVMDGATIDKIVSGEVNIKGVYGY